MKKKNNWKVFLLAVILGIFTIGLTTASAASAAMKRPSVKAAKTADDNIKISWSTQSNISGYRIYRKTSSGAKWAYLRNVNSRSSSYTDKNVEGGKTYYYTVRAFRKTTTGQGTTKTSFGSYNSKGVSVKLPLTRWQNLLNKYLPSKTVNQLVFVKHTGGSFARVEMYTKKSGKWNKIVNCQGYVGTNGIDKVREGDRRTPTGTFNLTQAYGIKDDPGAKLDYVKVNKYLYWCGDAAYYNQLIDIRKKPHTCHGEHLIDYVPHYNYGMFLDFNKKNVVGKGAAIFLHCTGSSQATAGCVAVSEANMIKIIRNAEKGAKICIYHEK